jgi:large subunit ribosomal protein L29
MRANELRHKSPDELGTMERDLSEKLFALRLQKVTGQLESPSKIRGMKRDLARILTVMNEQKRQTGAAATR